MSVEISPVAMGMIVSGAVVSIWHVIHCSHLKVESERLRDNRFYDMEFRVAKSAYVWPLFLILLGCGLIAFANDYPNGTSIIRIVAIAVILLGLFVMRMRAYSSVAFQNGSLIVREGNSERKIRLTDIISVTFANWYGVNVQIHIKNGQPLNISMHYKNNAKLLAMLRYFRLES